VQSWLNGTVTSDPPDSDADWQCLLDHFAHIHRFTPEQTTIKLAPPVLNCQTAAQGIEHTRWQMQQLPEPPPELQALFDKLENTSYPDWPSPTLALCRTDPNTLNFVRRADHWRSVDWENSGWGDPAFEIADMMIHPAYIPVSTTRWEWVIKRYAEQVADVMVERRIRTYYRILAVWWVARMARYLYEIPRGLDQRLVERPADWLAQAEQKYTHYLDLAQNLIDD
jgi:thiamine kinase-like enzyme